MEKGMLNIRRNGKKVILGIVKENKKILSISDSSLRKAEIWEGIADGDHEASYVLENGTNIIELTIGDKTIRPEQVQPPKQAGQGNRNFNNNDRSAQHPTGIDSAKAPYNFIPINEEVIFVDEKEVPAFNSYKGYDGYIELEIKAMSPIYIRRNLKPEEQEKEDALGHDHNNKEALAFKESLSGFNRPLDAAYRIPGSSLRGMIRTLYEIVTYSKMTMIDDHKLYFRSFADKSIELRKLYASAMIENSNEAYRPKVRAGYIKKTGTKYEILEASTYYRVEDELVVKNGIIPYPMSVPMNGKNKSNVKYNTFIEEHPFISVVFKAEPEAVHHHSVNMLYSKVSDVKKTTDPIPDGYQKGYLVLSGWIPSKRVGKHMHWIIPEPTTQKYQVSDSLINDYNKDKNRKGTNILKWADKKGQAPCFFIVEDGQIKAFGHTGMFRMIYDKSIGDLLPPKHKSNDLDMTEAVFGRIADNQAKMGRVYFEDAICIDPKETNAAQHPKILSAPKPSSFQLYLHQDKNAIKLQGKKIKFLNNYNTSGARLAGHKLYWHRDPKDWVADKQEVTNHQTQYTMIQPLDTGSVFKGRIRFLNLSKEELGALLFVLNLPEGCCHKLGMAKPLGLGSVRLNAQLSLIDRKKRYSDLTSLGISATEDGEYVNAFINFLRDKLGLKGDIWETERLKELKRILDFAYKPDNEQTRYMEIEHGKNQEQRKVNEYSNRPILKKPSEIDNLTTKALKIGTEPQK